ncbi:MAG: S46 family peptidase [Marinilabiliales bacterium]|nr:S46 family peptidase [Marinilabiliales bacterium]
MTSPSNRISRALSCVDIRYVLWVIDIYSGAGHLLKEMDIRQ